MAARANYIIDQGANFSSTVTVKDSQGVALNLTGYTASANMALGHASTRTRTALTIEFASDRTTGNVSMSLTAAQTALLGRAKANSMAQLGQYTTDGESATAMLMASGTLPFM